MIADQNIHTEVHRSNCSNSCKDVRDLVLRLLNSSEMVLVDNKFPTSLQVSSAHVLLQLFFYGCFMVSYLHLDISHRVTTGLSLSHAINPNNQPRANECIKVYTRCLPSPGELSPEKSCAVFAVRFHSANLSQI